MCHLVCCLSLLAPCECCASRHAILIGDLESCLQIAMRCGSVPVLASASASASVLGSAGGGVATGEDGWSCRVDRVMPRAMVCDLRTRARVVGQPVAAHGVTASSEKPCPVPAAVGRTETRCHARLDAARRSAWCPCLLSAAIAMSPRPSLFRKSTTAAPISAAISFTAAAYSPAAPLVLSATPVALSP